MKRFFNNLNGNLNEKNEVDMKDNPVEKRNLILAEKKTKIKRESEEFKEKLNIARPKTGFKVRKII